MGELTNPDPGLARVLQELEQAAGRPRPKINLVHVEGRVGHLEMTGNTIDAPAGTDAGMLSVGERGSVDLARLEANIIVARDTGDSVQLIRYVQAALAADPPRPGVARRAFDALTAVAPIVADGLALTRRFLGA